MTNHDRYRPATLTACELRLGEAHLAIVTAANAMHAASYVAFLPGMPHPITKTDFGRDVGGDEIARLVSRNLRIFSTLKERTEIVLDAMQHLLNEARNLRDRHRHQLTSTLLTISVAGLNRAVIGSRRSLGTLTGCMSSIR